MKAYMMRDDDVLVEATIPDGTLLLEVDSRLNPDGGPDLTPISDIDDERKVFRRGVGAWTPFPDRTCEAKDLTWTPVP